MFIANLGGIPVLLTLDTSPMLPKVLGNTTYLISEMLICKQAERIFSKKILKMRQDYGTNLLLFMISCRGDFTKVFVIVILLDGQLSGGQSQ